MKTQMQWRETRDGALEAKKEAFYRFRCSSSKEDLKPNPYITRGWDSTPEGDHTRKSLTTVQSTLEARDELWCLFLGLVGWVRILTWIHVLYRKKEWKKAMWVKVEMNWISNSSFLIEQRWRLDERWLGAAVKRRSSADGWVWISSQSIYVQLMTGIVTCGVKGHRYCRQLRQPSSFHRCQK